MTGTALFAAYADQAEREGWNRAVFSSNILYAWYQADFARLFIWFGGTNKPTTRYCYHDVTPAEYAAFMAADSHGTYLHRQFKSKGYLVSGPF